MVFDKLVWLQTCGKHIAAQSYEHCPMVEVQAYAAWLEGHRGWKKNKKWLFSEPTTNAKEYKLACFNGMQCLYNCNVPNIIKARGC